MTTPVESVDDAKEDAAITGVIRRMQSRFRGGDPAHVRGLVRGHHRHLSTARIRTYVPVLVEHDSRGTLNTISPLPSAVGLSGVRSRLAAFRLARPTVRVDKHRRRDPHRPRRDGHPRADLSASR